MSNASKSNIATEQDRFEVSSARQAFSRVAIVTLIAIGAAALVLFAVLLIVIG